MVRSSPGLRTPGARRRRGSAVVLVFALLVLFGLLALAVDLGTQQLARVQYQAGVDAAVLAGAAQLDRTDEGLYAAEQATLDYAARNDLLGEPIVLEPGQVLFGTWDASTDTFVTQDDPALIDTLQVRSTERVPTFFASVAFGVTEVGVSTVATATRPLAPAAELDCFLPIALPECTWEQALAGDQGDHHYVFSADGDDNVGWAHPLSPTPSTIEDTLQGLVDGSCDDGLDPFVTGEPIEVNNGVQNSTLRMLRDALRASSDPWRSDLWGTKMAADPDSFFTAEEYPATGVLQGPVAVFDDGGVTCSDVQFNQSQPTVAYAWGVIFDVFDGTGKHTGFQLYIDTDHEWEPTGGAGYGTGNVLALQHPVLVGAGG